MKKYSILTAAFLFLFVNILMAKEPAYSFTAYKVYDSDGDEVEFEDVLDRSLEADIVFFGELHNNSIVHWLQLELLKALHSESEDNETVAVGMEMFEADDQLLLDEYMEGLIAGRHFEKEAKLWGNYKTDYKPIVEYAVDNGIPLIAANIPRRYAARVARGGFESLEDLSGKAKEYFPPLPIEADLSLGCYKKMESMAAHMPAMKKTDSKADEEKQNEKSDNEKEKKNAFSGKKPAHFDHGKMINMMRNFKQAQAVKDATMAYFIEKNMPEDGIFLHLTGAYHIDNYEGIVWFVKRDMPLKEIVTVSTIEKDCIDEISDSEAEKADFIIVTPSSVLKTH